MIVVLGLAVVGYLIFSSSQPTVEVAPPGASGLPAAESATPPTSGTGQTTGNPASPTGTPIVVSPRIVQITTGPIVPGEVIVNIKSSSTTPADTVVKYIARESGNVYSYAIKSKTLTRTSNRTLPGIQSASWLPDGSAAFVRYLSGTNFSTINTYALPAGGTGGFFLSQNLSDVAVSSTSVLTLVSGVNGSSASLLRTDGTKPVQLFTTSLSSLRVSFAGKSQYLAFTKPTMTLPGFAYIVDGAGGFTRIAGPRNGLVALASPLGRWVIVSYADGGALHMDLVNTTTGESLPLPVSTIVDKCAWAANDFAIYCGIPVDPSTNYNYPDDWYQGAISFNDRIWKIDTAGRYAQLVLDFSKETNKQLDAEALAVDLSNTTLVFMNKNDASLWSYSL